MARNVSRSGAFCLALDRGGSAQATRLIPAKVAGNVAAGPRRADPDFLCCSGFISAMPFFLPGNTRDAVKMGGRLLHNGAQEHRHTL